MKRWLLILTLLTLACVVPSLTLETQLQDTPSLETKVLTATPSITLQPTFTPTPQLAVTPTQVTVPGLDPESISVYPFDLFPNDHFSIDVAPQIPAGMTGTMTITVNLPDGISRHQTLEPTGLDEERRARFQWVNQVPDDTSPLELTFILESPTGLNSDVTQTVSLTTHISVLPIELLPPPEPDAHWTLTQTEGFQIHYITGTKAERELDFIISEANQAYSDITEYLGESREDVDIYILDRVIGQGGYASSLWVAISYPDRAYSPIGLRPLLRHELTHRLDSSIGCSDAPAFVREGLAVFLAGGHYREESIVTKASIAMANGYITPFTQLITDFYIQQHEISYLDAAAFVSYIEDQYGWDGITLLCEVSAKTEGSNLDKLNAASQAIAKTDAANLISLYRIWLSHQPAEPIDQELFEHELQLMELMRHYQLAHDPAAHFLKGILFNPEQGKRQDIVADFVRSPISEEAIAIELILTAGQDAVVRQDVQFLRTILSLLDTILVDGQNDVEVFNDVVQIVLYVQRLGFEPYNLEFLGDNEYELAVLNLSNWPQTMKLQIGWHNNRWMITGGQ